MIPLNPCAEITKKCDKVLIISHREVEQIINKHMNHKFEMVWDKLAQDRTFESISTSSNNDPILFWKSGERTAQFLLDLLPSDFPHNATALDFGVGIGRIARPMTQLFSLVIGVDVSKKMLEKLRQETTLEGHSKIVSFHIDEPWEHQPVDFVYSVLTFQHMPDKEVQIALKRLHKTTKNLAYFQFDTRPRLTRQLTRLLPLKWISWKWQPGMQRIARKAPIVREWITEAGFEIINEFQPNTELHGFLVQQN